MPLKPTIGSVSCCEGRPKAWETKVEANATLRIVCPYFMSFAITKISIFDISRGTRIGEYFGKQTSRRVPFPTGNIIPDRTGLGGRWQGRQAGISGTGPPLWLSKKKWSNFVSEPVPASPAGRPPPVSPSESASAYPQAGERTGQPTAHIRVKSRDGNRRAASRRTVQAPIRTPSHFHELRLFRAPTSERLPQVPAAG